MNLHQYLYLHLLFPTLNHCLNHGSFGRNRADMNIQQPTTPEVGNTEAVMVYNEDIDLPPPQDISNVFAVA